jgi:hypothetical protein
VPDAYSNAGVTAASKAKSDLEALFGGGNPQAAAPSAADQARAQLDALFGKK